MPSQHDSDNAARAELDSDDFRRDCWFSVTARSQVGSNRRSARSGLPRRMPVPATSLGLRPSAPRADPLTTHLRVALEPLSGVARQVQNCGDCAVLRPGKPALALRFTANRAFAPPLFPSRRSRVRSPSSAFPPVAAPCISSHSFPRCWSGFPAEGPAHSPAPSSAA
jgi:hypothetical protein